MTAPTCISSSSAASKPGVSIEQAGAELRVIAARLERALSSRERQDQRRRSSRCAIRSAQQSRLLLVALVGASLCVLLIACTNLANLLLARSLGRRARGGGAGGARRRPRAPGPADADRERRCSPVCGGLLGVVVAVVAAPLAARLVPTALPIAEAPGVDLRMLALAALVTLATGLGFGVLPAIRASGRDAARRAARWRARRRSRHTERVRAVLVVAEVVASVVLLVGAGLLIRAMWRVQDIDPGFRAAGVLTMRTHLPLPKYAMVDGACSSTAGDLARCEALPGVQQRGLHQRAADGHARRHLARAPTSRRRRPRRRASASLRFVTPGFFDTLGIPLRRGRDVAETDTGQQPQVAVVSESFVRLLRSAGQPAAGPTLLHGAFASGRSSASSATCGCAGSSARASRRCTCRPRRCRTAACTFYVPKDLVVRTASASAALVPAIRGILARADPEQPVSDVRLLSDIVDGETAPRLVQVARSRRVRRHRDPARRSRHPRAVVVQRVASAAAGDRACGWRSVRDRATSCAWSRARR